MRKIIDAARPLRSRGGFSLIEMLIVLAIIVLLSSMIIFGASALGIGSKKQKSGTILAAVRKGIELTIANRGGAISPVEHPFAGSKSVSGNIRLSFLGKRGRTLPNPSLPASVSNQPTGGSWTGLSVGLDSNTGTWTSYRPDALKGADEWQIDVGARTRLLMDDDLFADKNFPICFGLQRGYMGVIGAQQENVTAFTRVPRPKAPATVTSGPYDDQTLFPDALYKNVIVNAPPLPPVLASHSGLPRDNKSAIDYLFGNSNVGAELSSLKAIYTPPSDPTNTAPADNADKLIAGKRVWSEHGPDSPSTEGHANYLPGRIQTGDPLKWRHYRLRGMAIYDAWEQEILCSYNSAGGMRMISAGADRVFVINPGKNDKIEDGTDANEAAAGTFTGDDTDGGRDNVKQEVVE